MSKPIYVMAFSSKSNVSKTTLLFLVAWCLALRGIRVKVIDADPKHETLSYWLATVAKSLNGNSPVPFASGTAMTKREVAAIPQESEGCDLVLIDIEGGNDELATVAAGFSDLAVVATSDSVLEYVTVAEAFSAVRVGEAKTRNHVEKALLFTRMTPGATTLVKERQNAWLKRQEAEGIPEDDRVAVFTNFFPRLNAYKDVGFRHPEAVGLDIGEGSDVYAIADELIDALGIEATDA